MGTIVPRWEWRAFGSEFGEAEARFKALGAEKVQESEETYLLAVGSDANVKIRDNLLDIKLLESVNDDGLERWRPVLKEGFPLSPIALAQAREALGLPTSPRPTGSASLDSLLAELSRPAGPVRMVEVHKTRTRYNVQGCTAEVTNVTADGLPVRTIAIEDEDPAKVTAAVTVMGLQSFPNTSYPRGLKALVGMAGRGPK